MKKLLIITTIFAGLIFSCQTSEDIDQIALAKKTAIPDFAKNTSLDAYINGADIAAAAFGFVVDIVQGEVESIDVKAIYDGSASFAPVTIATSITELPYSQDMTANDLVDLFPEFTDVTDIPLGAEFTVYADLTLKDGTVIPGRTEDGINYSPDIVNSPLFTTNVVFAVLCPYDVTLTTGSFHAISGSWGSEGDITITADPDDPYILYVVGLEEIEGLVEDLDPLKMVVDPTTFEVTAIRTAIASDAWGYHNIAYEGPGTLNTCNGTFSMQYKITVDEGTFGTFSFTLTKN